MDNAAVIATLNEIRDAKAKWAAAVTKFNADAEYVLKHLIREAAHNRMSAEQVAAASGYTVKRVRAVMREIGLNPRDGKALLEKKAAEALAANADLLGVKPGEIDLTSPLAYLPAGSLLKDAVHDQRAARVTEIEYDPIPALRDMAETCECTSNKPTIYQKRYCGCDIAAVLDGEQ